MIGVFDSGIGGLTVVKEIKKRLPDYSLVYFGDTARLPYGTKSRRTIIRYAEENTNFLTRRGSRIIVIACNTASALAGGYLARTTALPLFDVITPAVRAAKAHTRNRRIGVIGTPATISSGAYQRSFGRNNAPYLLYGQACPLFVPLVEENWINRQETYSIARSYLEPLKKKHIDTLILGCTHYPLLASVIRDILGKGVMLVNPARELAEDLAAFVKTRKQEMVRGKQDSFFVSDEPYRFKELSEMILGKPIKVTLVTAFPPSHEDQRGR